MEEIPHEEDLVLASHSQGASLVPRIVSLLTRPVKALVVFNTFDIPTSTFPDVYNSWCLCGTKVNINLI